MFIWLLLTFGHFFEHYYFLLWYKQYEVQKSLLIKCNLWFQSYFRSITFDSDKFFSWISLSFANIKRIKTLDRKKRSNEYGTNVIYENRCLTIESQMHSITYQFHHRFYCYVFIFISLKYRYVFKRNNDETTWHVKYQVSLSVLAVAFLLACFAPFLLYCKISN